jgi:hypothetical protein
MKVELTIDMPKPGGHTPDTIEERAEAACDLIESGHESRKEWDFIRALNNELVQRKKSGRICGRGTALLELIAPAINKHGMRDPRGVDVDPEMAMKG